MPFSTLTNINLETSIQGKNCKSKNFCTDSNIISDDDENYDLIHSNYYDIDTLNSLQLGKNNSNILHLNIASLAYHIDELRTLLKSLSLNFYWYL